MTKEGNTEGRLTGWEAAGALLVPAARLGDVVFDCEGWLGGAPKEDT
jgi:hypothetical protein